MLTSRDRLRSHAADRDLYARTRPALAENERKYVQNHAHARTLVIQEIIERARGRVEFPGGGPCPPIAGLGRWAWPTRLLLRPPQDVHRVVEARIVDAGRAVLIRVVAATRRESSILRRRSAGQRGESDVGLGSWRESPERCTPVVGPPVGSLALPSLAGFATEVLVGLGDAGDLAVLPAVQTGNLVASAGVRRGVDLGKTESELRILLHQNSGSYLFGRYCGRTEGDGNSGVAFAVPPSTRLGCAKGRSVVRFGRIDSAPDDGARHEVPSCRGNRRRRTPSAPRPRRSVHRSRPITGRSA